MLKIRRGKRDDLGMIFHIAPLPYALRMAKTLWNLAILSAVGLNPSLEPSRQDSSDEGSQHMLFLRNKKNYL